MAKENFSEIAQMYALTTGQEPLLPVIEKEMLHYYILGALDKAGILKLVTFQGGTCLRLCYGGIRYSEDLDFACGERFEEIEPKDVENILKNTVEKRFDVKVRLKPPKQKSFEAGSEMKRWWVVVNTAPERPDLPSQKIKLEFASIPSYTKSPRQVNASYADYLGGYETLVVNAQSPSEILADKLVALPNTNADEYIRYRDLWDINWLVSTGKANLEEAISLSVRKHRDYCCDATYLELMKEGASRAALVRSDEFEKQMERFIPAALLERTLGRNEQLDAVEQTVRAAFEAAAKSQLMGKSNEREQKRYPSPGELTASPIATQLGKISFEYAYENGSCLRATLEQDGVWCFASRFDDVNEMNYSRTFEDGFLTNYRLVNMRRETANLPTLPIMLVDSATAVEYTSDTDKMKDLLSHAFTEAEKRINEAAQPAKHKPSPIIEANSNVIMKDSGFGHNQR